MLPGEPRREEEVFVPMSADGVNLADWLATPEGPPERVWRAALRLIATEEEPGGGSVEDGAEEPGGGAEPIDTGLAPEGDPAGGDELLVSDAPAETSLIPDGEALLPGGDAPMPHDEDGHGGAPFA